MTTQSSSGSKKDGRAGRKPGKKRYVTSNRRFKNKLKRVRQSSGEEAAAEYSARYRHRPVGRRVGIKYSDGE